MRRRDKPKKCRSKRKKDGKPCTRFALPGKYTCLLHTGDTAKRMGSKGGKMNRHTMRDLVPSRPPVKNIDEMIERCAELYEDIAAAKKNRMPAHILDAHFKAFNAYSKLTIAAITRSNNQPQGGAGTPPVLNIKFVNAKKESA